MLNTIPKKLQTVGVWCKRHPYLTLICIMLSFIINWPPLPHQKMALEIWNYTNIHDDVGQLYYQLDGKLYKPVEPQLVESYVNKFVKEGQHYKQALSNLEKEHFECKYREIQPNRDELLYKASRELQCSLFEPAQSILPTEISKRIDYISADYKIDDKGLKVIKPKTNSAGKGVYFSHSGSKIDETDLAVNRIVRKYVKEGMHYTQVQNIMEANNFKCFYKPYAKGQDVEMYSLFCNMLDPTTIIKSPTLGLATNDVDSRFVLDVQTHKVIDIHSSANYS